MVRLAKLVGFKLYFVLLAAAILSSFMVLALQCGVDALDASAASSTGVGGALLMSMPLLLYGVPYGIWSSLPCEGVSLLFITVFIYYSAILLVFALPDGADLSSAKRVLLRVLFWLVIGSHVAASVAEAALVYRLVLSD